MELTFTKRLLGVAILGAITYIFGIIAEDLKPQEGTINKYTKECEYPPGPVSVLYCGYLSVLFTAFTSVGGFISVTHPYRNEHPIPHERLFASYTMVFHYYFAQLVSVLAASLLAWGTVTEYYHMVDGIAMNVNDKCKKTGIFGGGGVIALCGTLYWLCSLTLATNAREDYLAEMNENNNQMAAQ